MKNKIIDIVVYIVLSIALMSIIISITVLISYELLLYALPALMFIPLISTIITNKLLLKRSLSEFGINIRKFYIRYIVIALLYPFMIIGISIPIAYVIGIEIDFSFSELFNTLVQISQTSGLPYQTVIILFTIQLITAPFFNMIFAFGEEAGWRGYLLTRLEEEFGTEQAIILSGFVWGLWHWPLILAIGYNYTYEARYYGAILFVISTIMIGVFLSWLRIKTDSVIMPSLAHGAFNAYVNLGSYLLLIGPLMGYPAGVIPIIAETIIAVILWIYFIHKAK